ncbi:hypothetical protein KI387_032204, partial [Taxus chinensis]
FYNDLEGSNFRGYETDNMEKPKADVGATQILNLSCAKKKLGKSLKRKVLSRVFSEDYERGNKRILDPRGKYIQQWSRIFFVACIVSLFVDPLFFYLPKVNSKACVEVVSPLDIIVTVLRSITDLFYLFHMFVQFHTAYVAPSSRVFGRGELIIDPAKIASRYLMKKFWIDLIRVLPMPQVILWLVIPSLSGSVPDSTKNMLRFLVIFQYLPRLLMIFPLSSKIVKTTGMVIEAAWAGAAYNLLLYILASHVLGACWYLLAIERQDSCWRQVCRSEMLHCHNGYFDCRSLKSKLRDEWFNSSSITDTCITNRNSYNFGIYEEALDFTTTSSGFINKYCYCLWWGVQNLSSLGQNLQTSIYVGEISFAILIVILGLVLFALLIGNMQTYLQSITVRLEEWRIKRTDTEEWMKHRQLPPELRECIRRYDQYKWVATRGVDEESLLQSLPMDLRRDIKRHLCLDLVRRVPLFDQMDERMLDAICERLKPALSTQGTFLVREGDPVNEMLFIIRGHLDSYTTNGGRSGFFNSTIIGPGDFCGEELLTWALDPKPCLMLASSTRTVKALVEVEAFALRAEDLKFVASQFRRLHSKQLQHTFRFYSHQWRSWAACFIQAAWRRFKKRKLAELRVKDNKHMQEGVSTNSISVPSLGVTIYASRFADNTRRGAQKHKSLGSEGVGDKRGTLEKPTEPDFSAEEGE